MPGTVSFAAADLAGAAQQNRTPPPGPRPGAGAAGGSGGLGPAPASPAPRPIETLKLALLTSQVSAFV